MVKYDGLIQGNCKHERQEWQEMSWGEEAWRCMDCGEVSLRYMDCGSGG